jgi:AmiR/NasT family two-component response regulator
MTPAHVADLMNLRGNELEGVEAVLVDFDGLEPEQRAKCLLKLRQWNSAVIGLRSSGSANPADYLSAGLDAVVSDRATSVELAAAIWSAHKQAQIRCELQKRLAQLESEAFHAELIERATVILAAQSKCTQGEALRLLRQEARRQRRPMWELANAVMAADDILASRSTQPPRENKPEA